MKQIYFLCLISLLWTTFTQAQCFVQIASGEQHTVAIADDGTLWAWGSNTSSECGIVPASNVLSPTQIGSDSDWIDVDCGPYHTIALRSNGNVYTMGYNNNGQCGTGNTATVTTPTQVATGAINVAAGKGYASYMIKSDSTLWACGLNNGRYGDGSTATSQTFVQVSTATNWLDVAGGLNHSIALNSAGELYTSGNNIQGQLGLGNYTATNTRTQVNTGGNPPSTVSNQAISAGVNFSVYLDNFGQVHTCGSNANGRLGIGNQGITELTSFYPLTLQNMSYVKAGYDGCMAWNAIELNAWGRNQYSIISTSPDAYSPVLANYTTSPIDASMGLFNIAVISDGDGVVNWGANDRGNCGDGTTTHRYAPQLNNAQCQGPCAITAVTIDNVSACDPATNSYTVTFTTTYENANPADSMLVGGVGMPSIRFPVTGSPQTETITIDFDEINGSFTLSVSLETYNMLYPNFSCVLPGITNPWTAPSPCNSTGVNELVMVMNIYPNPADDQLIVALSKASSISILDLQGKQLLNSESSDKHQLNVANLQAGIYLIQTENGSINRFVKN